MANQNWGEVMTTTLASRRKDIGDAISRNNILIAELRRKGRAKKKSGGYALTAPIMMGEENGNFVWYSGRDPLLGADQDVLTSAEFDWKQYAVGVSMSGRDMLINSGPEQIIDRMAQRIEHAKITITNAMHRAAHGDGTMYGGKEYGGLGLLISEVAGATVGGISSAPAIAPWWDNQRQITGADPDKATIYHHMLALYLKCSLDTQKPDLIVSDNDWYAAYAESLQAGQRFTNAAMAAAGFDNLMWGTKTPVVADGGMGGYAPSGMKFINTN
ncbi:MAG: hypothetical protein RL268_2410, partial [Pseudomonadota bacterium]